MDLKNLSRKGNLEDFQTWACLLGSKCFAAVPLGYFWIIVCVNVTSVTDIPNKRYSCDFYSFQTKLYIVKDQFITT